MEFINKNEIDEIKETLQTYLDKFLGRENVEEIIESSKISILEFENICNKILQYNINSNILSENVLIDLEMFEGLGNDKENSIFNFINKTKTHIGKCLLKNIISNPITDIKILNNRQLFIKKIHNNEELKKNIENRIINISNKESELLWLWKDLNDETKYLFNMVYFQSRFLRWLNHNELAMRLYNYYAIIFSPIYGIISPIFMFLAPFILLKFYFKDNISIRSYLSIVRVIFSGFSNVFNINLKEENQNYTAFSMTNIISILIWVIFYIHGLFSNINSAINTNKITNILHNKLNNISKLVREGHNIYELLANDINENNYLINCNVEKHFKILWDDIFDEKPCLYSNKGRILKTYKIISEKKEKLIDLIKYIGNIDAYLSIVNLLDSKDYEIKYSLAEICHEKKYPFIETENMAYPILKKKTIKNEIKLGLSNPRNACITGPNAGGKSTFIKSLCICVILGQTITIVPATKFKFTPFSIIHTYLNIPDCKGKESLFEAEMNRSLSYIEEIKKLASNKFSFVIMDEIFSSTNPEEGISGAYAIANNIAKNNNSMSIITSHYSYLSKLENTGKFKNYRIPITRDKDNNIVYKYKLEPGVSNQFIALELLEKKGFNQDIVCEAKEICKSLNLNNFRNRKISNLNLKKLKKSNSRIKTKDIDTSDEDNTDYIIDDKNINNVSETNVSETNVSETNVSETNVSETNVSEKKPKKKKEKDIKEK